MSQCVKAAAWMADLVRPGLLQPRFMPPKPIRDRRQLLRYRKQLVQERAEEITRWQQPLEGATSKLAAVATDLFGQSGRARLEAVAGGAQDAQALAELARGRLRAKLPQVRQAVDGRVQAHQRVLLQRSIAHRAFLEDSLALVQQEREHRRVPFEEAMTLVHGGTGIQATAAAAILAEIGVDPRRFASDQPLASWAGVCPGTPQSGGKRLSGKPRKGHP